MLNYFKNFYNKLKKKFNQEQINQLENTLEKLEKNIEFLDYNQKIKFFEPKYYIGQDNISFRYNNLSFYNLFNFKNLDDIKVKRLPHTSSFFSKNKEYFIEKDKIYTIKKFEKDWIYLKEFGDFNGEFKQINFELENGFKVCLINDNKLCLIDKNNAIIYSHTYLKEPLNYSIQKEVDKFYQIATDITKYLFEKNIELNNDYDYKSILKKIDYSNEIINLNYNIER